MNIDTDKDKDGIKMPQKNRKFSDFLNEVAKDYKFGEDIDEIMAGTHDSKSCKLCQAVREGKI